MNVYSCWAVRVVGLRVSYAQGIVFIFSETVLNDKELCGPFILKLDFILKAAGNHHKFPYKRFHFAQLPLKKKTTN